MDNLTIIIPYYNGQDAIGKLLQTIPDSIPVLVVDDHSELPLNQELLTPNAKLLKAPEKGYFTGAVNFGIEHCYNDVLILNQDIYFSGNQWLNLLEEKSKDFDLIGEGIRGNHPAWPKGYIHGTFMFIKRKVIDRIGLMNEDLYPLWGSTCEFQLRACRNGFKALPLEDIPGFNHLREGNFGSAIKILLKKTDQRGKFIKTPPEISVITANHNYGHYLPDLINSLIGGDTSLGYFQPQTFQSFEVIIVDDFSTDDSRKIITGLCDDWKGVRAIFLDENVGSAAAINRGIELARGKYIAAIDADDMMETQRLETLYKTQVQNPHSFVFDECTLFANGERGILHKGQRVTRMRLHEYDFEEVLKRNGVHKGIMFPKVAWEETGGYPEGMRYGREDWAFNVALGISGYCGVKVNEPFYLYRREGQNRTLENTTPQWRQKFQTQMYELYADIYAGLRPMGCCGDGNKRLTQPVVPNMRVATMQDLPGRDGFAILEYIGTNAGDNSWWGPETGTQYVFGGVRKVGYVDKSDAPKMLKIKEHDKPIFRIIAKKKPRPVKKAKPKAEIEEAVTLEEKLKQEFEGEKKIAPVVENVSSRLEAIVPNPSEMTVSQIRDTIAGLDLAHLKALLQAEQEGKARKTAIGAIEEALNV